MVIKCVIHLKAKNVYFIGKKKDLGCCYKDLEWRLLVDLIVPLGNVMFLLQQKKAICKIRQVVYAYRIVYGLSG